MFKAIARWLLRKELAVLQSVIAIQEKELAKVVTKAEHPRLTTRLAYSEYQRFKAGLPPAVVTGSTTDLQAASLVGQQMVLDRLERELVNG